MAYAIRNHGNSRSFPFKGGHVFIARNDEITTHDKEMAMELATVDMVSVTKEKSPRAQSNRTRGNNQEKKSKGVVKCEEI